MATGDARDPLHVEPEILQGEVTDSAFGDEISSYSSSVRTSIYNFPERYGRKWHAFEEGRYCLPADEAELNRLDIFHHTILRASGNKLYLAPLPENFAGRVLDLGTGTGIWPIDFADQHPECQIVANDLAPVQPVMVPPNVQFYVEDIEAPWSHKDDEKFDFIHSRFLAGSIADWPKLTRQSFESLKPGGWVECQDWDSWLYSQDDSIPKESALQKFHDLAFHGRHNQGYSMAPGPELEKYMREAGFVDVKSLKIPIPLGPWPKDKDLKELGVLNLVLMEQGVEGIGYGILTQLPQEAGGPWTEEQLQVFFTDIRKDMRNKQIHGLYYFYVAYGRKPESSG